MAATAPTDIVIPAVWAPSIERETELASRIIQSGAIAESPAIQEQLDAGGQFINIPYMNPLTGNSEVLAAGTDMTVNAQTGSADIAVRLMRGKTWGWTDITNWIKAGTPLEDTAVQKIGQWWAYDLQTTLISVLKGIMATTLASTHVYDNTGETTPTMTATAIANAAEKLGDARETLSILLAHSHVVSDLEIADQVTALRDSESSVNFKRYQGKYLIIEDDDCPVTSGTPDVYTSYLIGTGAIAYGNAGIPADEAIEPSRSALGSESRLSVRRNHILHPIGVKYVGAANPTNTTLETGASWTKVYPNKLVRIVAISTH